MSDRYEPPDILEKMIDRICPAQYRLILPNALLDLKTMIAYHFISEKFALNVISDQCLKLSLLYDLNDPFELLSADLPDRKSRNRFIGNLFSCAPKFPVNSTFDYAIKWRE